MRKAARRQLTCRRAACAEYKTHNDLPLARIKRIMKADEDVRMISAEAPVLLAKAVEMFVADLTMRCVAAAAQARHGTQALRRCPFRPQILAAQLPGTGQAQDAVEV